jgi:hypothetical protein
MKEILLIIIILLFVTYVWLLFVSAKKGAKPYIITVSVWNFEGAYIQKDIGMRFKSYEDAYEFASKTISGDYTITKKI